MVSYRYHSVILGLYLVFFGRGYIITISIAETRNHYGAKVSVPVAKDVPDGISHASPRHGCEFAGNTSNYHWTDSRQLSGNNFWRPSGRIVELEN